MIPLAGVAILYDVEREHKQLERFFVFCLFVCFKKINSIHQQRKDTI